MHGCFAISPSLFPAPAPLLDPSGWGRAGAPLSIQTVANFFMPRPRDMDFEAANSRAAGLKASSLAEFRAVFGWQLSLAAVAALVLGMALGKAAFLSALAGAVVVLLPSWWQARALVRGPQNEAPAWRSWCRSHLGKWLGMTALIAAFVIGGRETLNFLVFFALILISQLAVLPALFKGQAAGAQSG